MQVQCDCHATLPWLISFSLDLPRMRESLQETYPERGGSFGSGARFTGFLGLFGSRRFFCPFGHRSTSVHGFACR